MFLRGGYDLNELIKTIYFINKCILYFLNIIIFFIFMLLITHSMEFVFVEMPSNQVLIHLVPID